MFAFAVHTNAYCVHCTLQMYIFREGVQYVYCTFQTYKNLRNRDVHLARTNSIYIKDVYMYVCVVQCACVTYNVHVLRTMYTSQVQCACITYIVRARRRSMYVVQVYSKIFFFSVEHTRRGRKNILSYVKSALIVRIQELLHHLCHPHSNIEAPIFEVILILLIKIALQRIERFQQIFIVQKMLLTLELWHDVDLILFCGAASANSLQEMLLALYANSAQEILLALCVNSSSQCFTPR